MVSERNLPVMSSLIIDDDFDGESYDSDDSAKCHLSTGSLECSASISTSSGAHSEKSTSDASNHTPVGTPDSEFVVLQTTETLFLLDTLSIEEDRCYCADGLTPTSLYGDTSGPISSVETPFSDSDWRELFVFLDIHQERHRAVEGLSPMAKFLAYHDGIEFSLVTGVGEATDTMDESS